MAPNTKKPAAKRTKPAGAARSPNGHFRYQLAEARKARGFSQAQLAKRLTEIGYKMHETSIARIESGERRVSLDDAMAISLALGCQLAQLVAPPDATARVEITERAVFPSEHVREWIGGSSH